MIFNLVTMYLYYKGLQAMRPESPKHKGAGSRDDDCHLKEKTLPAGSSYDRHIQRVHEEVGKFLKADSSDLLASSEEILKHAHNVRGWYAGSCADALEGVLLGLESRMPKGSEREKVCLNLAESILLVTRDSVEPWEGWFTLLKSEESASFAELALLGLTRGSREFLNRPEVSAAVLQAAERSDSCRKVALRVLEKFNLETFKANKDVIVKLGAWSLENMESQSDAVRAFSAVQMENELILPAVNGLEAGFAAARSKTRIELQRSKLETLIYCFPRGLFETAASSPEAFEALGRLEKLRDEAYQVVGDSGFHSGWYAPYLAKTCADIRVRHDFSSIEDWRTDLIPLLREPISLMGHAEFRNLSEKFGDRVLSAMQEHAGSVQAKEALPELEKLYAELVVRSLVDVCGLGWRDLAAKVNQVTTLISERHQIARSVSDQDIVAKVPLRMLEDWNAALERFGVSESHPYAQYVFSALAGKADQILAQTTSNCPIALRAFYAGEIDKKSSGRSIFDLLGRAADTIEIGIAKWGPISSVRERVDRFFSDKDARAVSNALVLIEKLARESA